MNLNARSVALQGFGFGVFHVALQGFVDVPVVNPTIPVNVSFRPFRVPAPVDLLALRREQLIDEDDLIVLIVSHLIAAGVLH